MGRTPQHLVLGEKCEQVEDGGGVHQLQPAHARTPRGGAVLTRGLARERGGDERPERPQDVEHAAHELVPRGAGHLEGAQEGRQQLEDRVPALEDEGRQVPRQRVGPHVPPLGPGPGGVAGHGHEQRVRGEPPHEPAVHQHPRQGGAPGRAEQEAQHRAHAHQGGRLPGRRRRRRRRRPQVEEAPLTPAPLLGGPGLPLRLAVGGDGRGQLDGVVRLGEGEGGALRHMREVAQQAPHHLVVPPVPAQAVPLLPVREEHCEQRLAHPHHLPAQGRRALAPVLSTLDTRALDARALVFGRPENRVGGEVGEAAKQGVVLHVLRVQVVAVG
mmetsp:Transcript_62884/g.141972  ORF Transcript_62884/g.141972 Transcript_62884/m.141972 type:complete len:328 (+) Transcript_62884:1020-2003(+)